MRTAEHHHHQRKVSSSLWWGYLKCPEASESVWTQPPSELPALPTGPSGIAGTGATGAAAHRAPGVAAGGRGWRQSKPSEIFLQSLRHYQNLTCSCRRNWRKYFCGNQLKNKPIKWTLPAFTDTFSKIALQVESTLNTSLLFFIQRYA